MAYFIFSTIKKNKILFAKINKQNECYSTSIIQKYSYNNFQFLKLEKEKVTQIKTIKKKKLKY